MYKVYYFRNDLGEIIQVIVPLQHCVGMFIEDTMCALLAETGVPYEWVDLTSSSTPYDLVRECTYGTHPTWVMCGPLDNWELVRDGMSADYLLRDVITGLIHYN